MVAARLNRIVRDPSVWSGDPIIRDTRIPVTFIVVQYEYEHSVDKVLEAFPHLDEDAIHQALAYYRRHQSEIDQLIVLRGIERAASAQANSA